MNKLPVDLLPGMTVKHALVGAGVLEKIAFGLKVYDEWGNELGLDGALYPGMKLSVK